MLNISIQNEKIKLEKGKFIIIDALYVNIIKDFLTNPSLNNSLSIIKIKQEIFPYTDTPFGTYEFKNDFDLSIENIKKIRYENKTQLTDRCVAIDSGLMLFIKYDIFIKFIHLFDYNKLIEKEPLDYEYWNSITELFRKTQLGLILSSGINYNFDFDGGGVYYINV
ncbi:MAG: hypothetical protein KDC55_12515 [Ignavibacteriae bacterium]|nr:hypothetical protein [Ignavibacteriota bacterium]MCB9222099.1 hypothetical protein [Ignavibacteria bacterium]